MSAEPTAGRRSGAERRREVLREIRLELEHVRRFEARVAEALGSLRAARQRIEELARTLDVEEEGIRHVVREELAAAVGRVEGGGAEGAATGPADVGARASTPDGPAEGEAPTAASEPGAVRAGPEDARRQFWLVAVAGASVLVVALVGWLGVQAFRAGTTGPAFVLVDDTAPPLSNGAAEAAGFFAALPLDARERTRVYDSLWAERSPLLAPLVEEVRAGSPDPAVRRAAAAWEEGPLPPLQADALHSAMVQLALTRETGAELAVDGRLLRNPCRGASCGALLDFWRDREGSLGLPPPPGDASPDVEAQRALEAVLVLGVLEELHGGRREPVSAGVAAGEEPDGP